MKTYLVSISLLTAILAGCAITDSKKESRVFTSPTGTFECAIPWRSKDVQIEHSEGQNQESVAFIIPHGSTHGLDRLKKNAHPLAKFPTGGSPAQRLDFAQKIYVSEALVPNFDLVETLLKETFTDAGVPIGIVVLNIENAQHSQHHGFLFFESDDFLNVMHYTHPLLWRPDMIADAVRDFYGKCQFNDLPSNTPPQTVTPAAGKG